MIIKKINPMDHVSVSMHPLTWRENSSFSEVLQHVQKQIVSVKTNINNKLFSEGLLKNDS